MLGAHRLTRSAFNSIEENGSKRRCTARGHLSTEAALSDLIYGLEKVTLVPSSRMLSADPDPHLTIFFINVLVHIIIVAYLAGSEARLRSGSRSFKAIGRESIGLEELRSLPAPNMHGHQSQIILLLNAFFSLTGQRITVGVFERKLTH